MAKWIQYENIKHKTRFTCTEQQWNDILANKVLMPDNGRRRFRKLGEIDSDSEKRSSFIPKELTSFKKKAEIEDVRLPEAEVKETKKPKTKSTSNG